MNSQKWFILIFVVLCFSIWGLDAKEIVINKNSLQKTIYCDGDEVVVKGNKNVLDIKGECSKLYVPGNKNTVKVEAVASISTMGNWNKVTWEKGIDGTRPSISNLGKSNTIKKKAVREEAVEEEEKEEQVGGGSSSGQLSNKIDNALSKLDILNKGRKGSAGSDSKSPGKSRVIRITGNSQLKTLTLQGEKLVVNGNFHKIKVQGFCSLLQVNGNTNLVRVDAVGTINTVGNMNKVYWKKGLDDEDPNISNLGTGNKIIQGEE